MNYCRQFARHATTVSVGKLGIVFLAAVMLTVGYLWGHLERSTEHEIGLVSEAEAASGEARLGVASNF